MIDTPTEPPRAPVLPPAGAPPMREGRPGPLLVSIAALGALLLIAVINAIAVPLPIAVAGGASLVGIAVLAVWRYEWAVGLGFALSAVVNVEPAPPDLVFAVIIAIAIVTGRLRLDRVPSPVVAALGALTAMNLFSMAGMLHSGHGLRFFAITLYLFVFAAWLAGYADRARRGRQIVLVWLTVGVLTAVAGVLALQVAGFPFRDVLLVDLSRARGLFKDPNVMGPFLIPITVILLEEMMSPRTLRISIPAGFVLLTILVVGIIYSFSRAAWGNLLLATVVMFAVMLFRRRHGRRFVTVAGGLMIVALAAAAFVIASGEQDFITQRAQLQGYDSDRFGAQRAGLQMAQDNPLGVGPGQFIFHHPIETHSTYIRVLAEQGIVGLAAWLALCLTTLGLAVGNAIRGRTAAGIGSAALLGAWCGLMLNAAVVDTLHWRHLWVVAGLIWAAAMTNAGSGSRAARPRRGGRLDPRIVGR